ncbi:hypothetical protein ABTF08_21375, partial [Acinetobacter baumannii]
MITPKLILAAGLLFHFSACASTNNGGHVVGNPLVSDSVSAKAKTKSAIDTSTATDTSTSTATDTKPAPKK